jgi:hypothetical protein
LSVNTTHLDQRSEFGLALAWSNQEDHLEAITVGEELLWIRDNPTSRSRSIALLGLVFLVALGHLRSSWPG